LLFLARSFCLRFWNQTWTWRGSMLRQLASSVRLAADLLISGNRGGQLKLWSLTDEGKHVATLMPFQSEDGDTPPAIQGLAASALDGVIAVAGNDQLVIYRPLQKK